MSDSLAVFWFRRDLRLEDNAGLYHALQSEHKVLPLFLFDREILDRLKDTKDARVSFIYQELQRLRTEVQKHNSDICVEYGKPMEVWKKLLKKYSVKAVYANHDYEPYAHERDDQVAKRFAKHEVKFHTYKDQVIFEKAEIVKDDGTPYSVYTPYSRRWREKLTPADIAPYESENHLDRLQSGLTFEMPSLESMGFTPSDITIPSREPELQTLKTYHQTRDYPAKAKGTSRIGLHLRFGTVSIRDLVKRAQQTNQTYLNELIWREFYMMILWHHPRVVDQSFRPEYDQIKWRNDEAEFAKWKTGQTGFPFVDAGMRELNATGYMHNRARMIVASFLCKHLLIDWRWGERYFAEKLLDYELASNNGGWQWAAGTGCDAAPYFRVFNPELQLKKFDPDLKYVKKWIPEYGTDQYPAPMVDHKTARLRALDIYKVGLKKT